MSGRSKRAKQINGFSMEWDSKLNYWTCSLKEWEASGYCRAQAKLHRGEWRMVRDHTHSLQLMEEFQRLTRANEIYYAPTKEEKNVTSDSEVESETSEFEKRTAELLEEARLTGQLETFECSTSSGKILRGYMVTSIRLEPMDYAVFGTEGETDGTVKRGKGRPRKQARTSSESEEDEEFESRTGRKNPSSSGNSSPASNKENVQDQLHKGRGKHRPASSEMSASFSTASSIDDQLFQALVSMSPEEALFIIQKFTESRLSDLERRSQRGENIREDGIQLSELVSKMEKLREFQQ